MARWLMEKLPEFVPYFNMLYGEAATLHFNQRTLLSEHGCQQGCAHGSLLFCAGEVAIMDEMKRTFLDVLFVCIAVDVYMLGPPLCTWSESTINKKQKKKQKKIYDSSNTKF